MPDLQLLTDAALEAGKIASKFFARSVKSWDKEGNLGPVTEADLEVNDYLEDILRKARPAYGWLSEESLDDENRLSDAFCFIIDPIDGTRSFIEGSKTWAISIAVAHHGKPTAAAIYLPEQNRLYTASKGSGAFYNGAPIKASSRTQLNGASALIARPTLDPKHWRTLPNLDRSFRPSLAYRLALIAEGRFDTMLTLRPSWEWDIAAGALLVTEAGGQISDRTGAALTFNNPEPRLNGVIAAADGIHAEIVSNLA